MGKCKYSPLDIWVGLCCIKSQDLFGLSLSRTPPINAQCRSMPINADQNHGIDPKSELIDIGINARILIGIDRHWALIEGVLTK